jgi:hypothetical protein
METQRPTNGRPKAILLLVPALSDPGRRQPQYPGIGPQLTPPDGGRTGPPLAAAAAVGGLAREALVVCAEATLKL